MNVTEVISERGGPCSTALGCSPRGASGVAEDSYCCPLYSVPCWHTAVRSSAHRLPLARSDTVQGGTPVSVPPVTSRAILRVLLPRVIIGGTQDGINEKASRRSAAESNESIRRGPLPAWLVRQPLCQPLIRDRGGCAQPSGSLRRRLSCWRGP